MYGSGDYRYLVNHRHVNPSSLNLDQFATMKSIRPQDGAVLTKWMQCCIHEDHLNRSLQQENHEQASHLCDTVGCLSEDHICMESREINDQRKKCDGIYVHIYENTAGEFLILQIDPCQHGKQHKQANDDFLKYSCRKIKAIFLKDDDLV